MRALLPDAGALRVDTMPRRVLIAGVVVALWMLPGVALHLGAESYLLVGVPLMLAFQRFVHRRPLRAAWVFDEKAPTVDARALAVGVAIAALPGARLIAALAGRPACPASLLLWLLAATIGGLAAGIALRAQRVDALRRALPTIAVAMLSFVFMFALAAIVAHGGHLRPPTASGLGDALEQAIVYFDVSFVLEEVAFRGVLDPYILGGERGPNAAWASAVVGSALWGLWHVPIALAPGAADLPTLVRLVLFHVGLGAMLCFVARLSGTLAPAAAVHGLADAFRNLIS
jgi:membrane protease YdiL (CAAX protease family)